MTRHASRVVRRYLDSADVILLALDMDGRITLVNRYACSVLGWSAQELLGREWIETCIPEGIRDAARATFHTLLGGELSVVEHPVLTKSGDARLIEWRNTLLRDDAGHVVGTFSSGSDNTERTRAEADARQHAQLSALSAVVGLALTESGSLVRALQQCAQALVTYLGADFAGIWTLNEREGVLDLQASAGLYTPPNGQRERIPLGHTTVGRIARDLRPHMTNDVIGDPEVDDREWARRKGMVAFAGHPLVVDGRVVGVMALFAPHALSEAAFSAMASVADHIALGIERLRSAEALRIAEERMRFALESADVGIWDMDYATGALQWSETLEAHYGLRPGTFGGTFDAFVERIHPDDRKSVVETIGTAATSGTDFSLLHRSVWPDGTVRWLSGAGRIHLGEHGAPARGLGISLDVTERRSLEAQYLQAQKMEAIGQLAGGVAHDFNNLLTVILGYCELLLEDLDAEDPRHAGIAEIQNAGTLATVFTRQLLAFSCKQIVEPAQLDLNVVVAGMRTMLGRLIREDVKVVLSLRPEPSPVKADRGELEQIVMNLAVNARDAMPRGGTLTIEIANVEIDGRIQKTPVPAKPGSYAVLSVTDTGTGMTAQVQARLFEPFFTTKAPGKGTGLGLATVHGIVTRSGGTVAVSSELGRGTSFQVYFPRADDAEPLADSPPPVPQSRGGTETVLVVEDAEEVRRLVSRQLERHGYTALVAADADEALGLFERNPAIDVLVTDVVMPGASGPELTRLLLEQRPALKVVYISGYPDEALDHDRDVGHGVAFLPKPFTSEALNRTIRQVLDRQV